MGFSKEGIIKGLDVHLYCNAGCSLDLSSSIMDRALLHTDNAYRLGAVRAVGHVCKTNMASNTAFRGFGGPQAWVLLAFCSSHDAQKHRNTPVGFETRFLGTLEDRRGAQPTPYSFRSRPNGSHLMGMPRRKRQTATRATVLQSVRCTFAS